MKLRPYIGEEPFIFISYSHHCEKNHIYDTLKALKNAPSDPNNFPDSLADPPSSPESRIRVWYDEGIEPGKNWSREIEKRMKLCSAVIFFQSAPALGSNNCFSEIKTATDMNKPVILVNMDGSVADGSDPSRNWPERLENAIRVPYDPDPEAQAKTILSSGVFDKKFAGPDYPASDDLIMRGRGVVGLIIGIVLSSLLLIGSLVGVYGIMNGWFFRESGSASSGTPVPTVTPSPTPGPTETPFDVPQIPGVGDTHTFGNPLIEKAVRKELLLDPDVEITDTDLNNVTELKVYGGDAYRKDLPSVPEYSDGDYRLNGVRIEAGSISNLTDLKSMPFLEKAVLISQKITDISPLRQLLSLKELDLSGNPVSGLPEAGTFRVTDMNNVEHAIREFYVLESLHIQHTGIRDLTPLSAYPALKTVTVSADMLPLKLDPDAAFEIELVK